MNNRYLTFLIFITFVLFNACEKGGSEQPFPGFEAYTIGHEGTQLGQTSLVDLDKDGDLDWVCGRANRAGGEIWWWEYRSADDWVQHLAGHGNTDVGGSVFDVNKDGWPDLLSGSILLIHPGSTPVEGFEAYDVGTTYSHDTEFADINKDGKMDVIANWDQAGLFWYEIPENPKSKWREHMVASSEEHEIHGGVSPKAVGDVDGDGDNDVVTGEAWYENSDGQGLQWQQHKNIDFGEHHKYGLAVRTWVVDLDDDGDNDFVQAEADNPDGRVAWFENDGTGNWTRHMIKDKGDQQDFHSLIVADFDLDGDQDVFAGGGPLSADSTFRSYIWENIATDGQKPSSDGWEEHVILHKPCHEAVGADVDGDGDIDICTKPWRTGDEHIYLRNMLVEGR